jgi:uncharacterized Zn finger protein (UPF0148 family)
MTEPLFQTCDRCGVELFQLNITDGVWVAVCSVCMNEYELVANGLWVVRQPGQEQTQPL